LKINDLFEMPAAKQQRSNNQRSDLIVSRLEKFIEESNYRVFEPKDEQFSGLVRQDLVLVH
jgi:hypothetical protein